MTSLPLLAIFLGRHGDSRLAEFDAVVARNGGPDVSGGWDAEVLPCNGGDTGPTVVQPLPPLGAPAEQQLSEAAAGTVSCRGLFEVWGTGDTVEACGASAARVPAAHLLARVTGPWRVESLVLGARKSQHGGDLAARMEPFGAVLDVLETHPVRLQGPAHRILLLEDRRVLEGGSSLPRPGPRYQLLFALAPTRQPLRADLSSLDLSRRAFLGSSTLPPDRALLLCNLGLARASGEQPALVDPYCGSGGILLAAAVLGARVVGSDLDWRVVSDNRMPLEFPPSARRPQRGSEPVRMTDNFDEAMLPRPQALLTLDVGAPDACKRLLAANGDQPYDALVTDPPYGRRELQGGAGGWAESQRFAVDAATLEGLLTRLLELASAVVKPGGRLVFLVPVKAPGDDQKPSQQALRKWLRNTGRTRGFSLQHLGVERVHRGLHRAVVAMERSPPTPGTQDAGQPLDP